jgi:1-aminocyclopropane-1-carboxylate deaminase/D-cysteine desulfhydrase-like pyridoxal-dependent ACC family enzyme
VPRVDLVPKPAPLLPLRALEGRLRSELGSPAEGGPWLFIKHDDVSRALVGGNKGRKLEFLLGEALARHARAVVTSGRLGTNHGLASAEAALRLGIPVTLVLGPQPVTEAVRRKLLAMRAAGAEIRFHSTLVGWALDVALYKLTAMVFPNELYYIPPSGTSDVGSIGYANAFFELLAQTGDEGLPDEIVVAASTGGTAAGLLAGMCLAGRWEQVRVRAVGVTEEWLQSEWLLRSEARDAFRAIRDALDPEDRARVAECDFMGSRSALTYEHGYLAPGYGQTDAQLDGVIGLLRDTEGVELDPTFTAKAMRHFLDRARERLLAGDTHRRLLFWNTYAPVDLEVAIRDHRWKDPERPWRDLPDEMQVLFDRPNGERRPGETTAPAVIGR